MTPTGPPSGTPADLPGVPFGPVEHVVDAERIARFVDASGDDTERWRDTAPPGYAATLLFAVAAPFLNDERIRSNTRTLIHVDQQFRYERPLSAGAYVVTGHVERVRERGDVWFVTFLAEARSASALAVSAASTFLLSAQPAGEPGADRPEPPVLERAESRVPPAAVAAASAVGPLASLAKSASRLDLVGYAAATGDYNPIHWDHAAARAAGLDGIVVHGLLMHAWLSQVAASVAPGSAPIAAIKSRFRSPLRPGASATVSGEIARLEGSIAELKLRLSSDAADIVTATATVRLGEE